MSTDKKYNRQTYTGLGAGMQDRLIKGAYLSARADAPDYSWMNAVSSGINAFGEEMGTRKANKEAEHEKIMSQIQGNVDEIYAMGGSMPEEYFDQAFTYTEKLRKDYLAAVESGDVKAQHKIKGQLNTFSTSIQNTKTSLTDGAASFKDGMLINEEGLTPNQKNIINSVKKGNAELDMETGVYKWRAVDIDGNPILDENGQQKYFTEEDYGGALVLRDDVNKEAYLSSNSSVLDAREKWLNGDGDEFDNSTNRKANIKIIDASIKSQGNMQSMIWDDITGFGSFAETIESHKDFVKYFDEDLEHFNMKDGLTNNVAIGLYDKDKDGHVGYEDFISAEEYPQYDTREPFGVITADELEEVYKADPTAKETVTKLAKEKIKNALLNPAKGQEGLTKSMLADFMTNRQSQMFYGGDDRYKDLIPGLGKTEYIKATKKEKGKLIINKVEIESLEAYKILGGSYKYLQDRGYYWNPKDGGWMLNEGAQFYNTDPMSAVEQGEKR